MPVYLSTMCQPVSDNLSRRHLHTATCLFLPQGQSSALRSMQLCCGRVVSMEHSAGVAVTAIFVFVTNWRLSFSTEHTSLFTSTLVVTVEQAKCTVHTYIRTWNFNDIVLWLEAQTTHCIRSTHTTSNSERYKILPNANEVIDAIWRLYGGDCLGHDSVVWPADTWRRSLPRILSQLLQGDDVPRTTAQNWRIRRVWEGSSRLTQYASWSHELLVLFSVLCQWYVPTVMCRQTARCRLQMFFHTRW